MHFVVLKYSALEVDVPIVFHFLECGSRFFLPIKIMYPKVNFIYVWINVKSESVCTFILPLPLRLYLIL